eukprot:gene11128-12403_t
MSTTTTTTALENTLNNIRAQILKYPSLKKLGDTIEDKTHINIEYLVLGLLAITALSLFSGLGASSVSNVIGTLYPTYATIVALETAQKHDDTTWLTYWVFFATLTSIENFVEFVIYWIPFYYPLKVTFLLWCMLPQYQGAEKAYRYLKSFSISSVNAVDQALSQVDAKKVVEAIKEKAT